MMKMEKLELKHLAAYLPYGLKMFNTKSGSVLEVVGLNQWFSDTAINVCANGKEYSMDIWPLKPLLIPIETLRCDKTANYDLLGGHRSWHLYPDDFMATGTPLCSLWYYMDVETLIKNHFDVFGLIDAGLAINKLTV